MLSLVASHRACFNLVRSSLPSITFAAVTFALAAPASAQWATFVNETATRIPTGIGQNDPAVTTADPEEKDFAWGDLDNDGDIDLVCVRKFPFTNPGGRRNVLYMNEGGVLRDRTSTKANTALGVPAGQGTSNGMLDATNDRDVVIGDVNNDGWLDVVTATTLSDGLPRYISHPRVYMNRGEIAGVWQGLRYEYDRFPQLIAKSGQPNAPRFCSVAIGDITGDGYADLYFGDYDGGSFTGMEPPANDMDNKVMINAGAGNPGVFVDQSVARMGTMFDYGDDDGLQTFNYATFGAASVIADMNGDGIKDVVKQTSLQSPVHVAVITNNPANVGMFTNYKVVYTGASYFVSEGDLNNDGRLDLVQSDDGADRYMLNTGNDASGAPNFTSATFTYQSGGDDGFAAQSIIIDLDNDGWKDVLIADVDVDDPGTTCDERRMHIFRNLANGPNVTLREDSPSIIPTTMLKGVHNVAVFDLNNDGWRDLVLGRCNSTEVWMNTGTRMTVPAPAEFVHPANGTAMPVNISISQVASVVPGSAKLFVSVNGGAFTQSPLVFVSGSQWTANLPAGACGDELRYYVEAQTTTGGTPSTLRQPDGAPANFYSAIRGVSLDPTFNQTFEGSIAGWTVSGVAAGAWEAADPVGTLAIAMQAAPEDDATPAPGVKAFITQNGAVGGAAGASDVDGGSTTLDSPSLDASVGQNRISFAYWFFTDNLTSGDSLAVSVSNDNGANWTPVRTYTARSGGWVRDSFRISTFVPQSNQVRVRFVATDGAASASTVEAGLDDLRIERVLCATACPADTNADSSVNVTDLLAVIGAWGTCGSCPPQSCAADTNDDCAINVTDLLAVIGAWGACPP